MVELRREDDKGELSEFTVATRGKDGEATTQDGVENTLKNQTFIEGYPDATISTTKTRDGNKVEVRNILNPEKLNPAETELLASAAITNVDRVASTLANGGARSIELLKGIKESKTAKPGLTVGSPEGVGVGDTPRETG